MGLSNEIIERQLMTARMLIANARASSDIRDALAAHGFTVARLDEGEALSNDLNTLCQRKTNHYGGLRVANVGAGARICDQHACRHQLAFDDFVR